MISISKRKLLRSGAALAGAGMLDMPMWERALAAGRLVIADPGGTVEASFANAFYKPFEQATGIKVAYGPQPNLALGQLKAMVLAGRVDWNVTFLTDYLTDVAIRENLLDKIDYSAMNKELLSEMLPGTVTPYSVGGVIFATVMAYRNAAFPGGAGPKDWADFWNVKAFPGRRSMIGFGNGPLEQALLASGVPKDKLYPLDLQRAFAELDQIRPYITVWSSSSEQQYQLMVNREVDVIEGFANRLQSAINDGAPYTIVWQDGSYEPQQWVLPRGAGARADSLKFIEFTLHARSQAKASGPDGTGPTNVRAIDFIPADLRPRMVTYPGNLEKMYRVNAEWLAENNNMLAEKWTAWKAHAG